VNTTNTAPNTPNTPNTRNLALDERIAGAPISWGVCEVPGWGWQYDPETVLTQMADIGLPATEFGPDDFLPADPEARARTLAEHDLQPVGQFVPVVLHDPGHDPLPEVERIIEGLVAARATTVVLAAAAGTEGYDARPELGEEGWATLLANLDRLEDAARTQGLVAALHPHVGTMVESGEETERVLAGSRIGLCLDTGHLLLGGGDPVTLAQQRAGRIAHVHLKDVRLEIALKVRSGELTYTEGVAQGMYVPLGEGDVDIASIVNSLEDHGYSGWYVLEQDTILTEAPGEAGPLDDVRTSLHHLLGIAAQRSGVGI
jgi:inosose dehydratase